MSPRERSAWIRLGSILIVFIPYFLHVLALFESDGPIGQPLCIAFVVAAIAQAVIGGVAQGLATLFFGADKADERDGAIDAKSLRTAYFTLVALVVGALGTIAFLGAITRPSDAGLILLPGFPVTSQFVFFSFVAAEALRYMTQVFCYRREARA